MNGSVYHRTATEAINDCFKVLAIDEFPSGKGKWRNNLSWRSDLLESFDFEDKAELYTVESLKELSISDPFQREISFSDDASNLQNMAISNPDKISQEFIWKFFKSLRIVDKQISSVDDGILKFENLKTLCMSANHIKSIDCKTLPRKLEVLELYGNNISDVSCLSVDPPKLLHLGIGANSISSIADLCRFSVWDNLLSLDLSENKLDDLLSVIIELRKMPKLKNLVLKKNPLSLFLGYRGYVIDSLTQLSVLDDIRISADERFCLKGMSMLKSLDPKQFVFKVKFDKLSGIMKPQVFDIDAGNPFPRIDTKYHVEFSCLANCKVKDLEVQDNDDNVQTNVVEVPSGNDPDATKPPQYTDSTNIMRTKEFVFVDEDMSVNYEKIFFGNQLNELKQYLHENIQIRLMEDKVVVSNDQSQEGATDVAMAFLERAKNHADKASSKLERGKSRASAAKNNKDDKPKAKGKKEKVEELFELGRKETQVASFNVDLSTLFEGSRVIFNENIIMKPESLDLSRQPLVHLEDSINDSKKKGKTLSANDDSQQLPRSTSAMRSGKRVKAGKSELKPPAPNLPCLDESGEANFVRPPITLDFTFQIMNWKDTKEAEEWMEKYL